MVADNEDCDFCTCLSLESDEVLFATFIRGNEDAFTELYNRHNDRLVARIHRVFHFGLSTAEDMAQEAWMGIYRDRGKFKPDERLGSFIGWLWTIAKHRCLGQLRSQRSRSRLQNELLTRAANEASRSAKPGQMVDYYAELDQTFAAANEKLEEIPEQLRFAIRAIYIDGQTSVAVAESLGVPGSTLHGRIDKALRRLRASLLN